MQERANDSEYGLAAGVFTSNLGLATTLSRGLKAGTVWVCYVFARCQAALHVWYLVITRLV